MAGDRITYSYLNRPFWWVVGLAAIFMGLGFYLAVWGNEGSALLALVGILILLFFAGLMWASLAEFLSKRPPFQITSRGILLGRIGPDVILWEDIDEVGFFNNRNSLSISVLVENFEPYVNPPSLPLKIWRMISLSRWMGTLSMSLDLIEGSEVEYIDTIESLKPPGKEFRYWLQGNVPPPDFDLDEAGEFVDEEDFEEDRLNIEGEVISSSEKLKK
jgi:hypothetical protein